MFCAPTNGGTILRDRLPKSAFLSRDFWASVTAQLRIKVERIKQRMRAKSGIQHVHTPSILKSVKMSYTGKKK